MAYEHERPAFLAEIAELEAQIAKRRAERRPSELAAALKMVAEEPRHRKPAFIVGGLIVVGCLALAWFDVGGSPGSTITCAGIALLCVWRLLVQTARDILARGAVQPSITDGSSRVEPARRI